MMTQPADNAWPVRGLIIAKSSLDVQILGHIVE